MYTRKSRCRYLTDCPLEVVDCAGLHSRNFFSDGTRATGGVWQMLRRGGQNSSPFTAESLALGSHDEVDASGEVIILSR